MGLARGLRLETRTLLVWENHWNEVRDSQRSTSDTEIRQKNPCAVGVCRPRCVVPRLASVLRVSPTDDRRLERRKLSESLREPRERQRRNGRTPSTNLHWFRSLLSKWGSFLKCGLRDWGGQEEVEGPSVLCDEEWKETGGARERVWRLGEKDSEAVSSVGAPGRRYQWSRC